MTEKERVGREHVAAWRASGLSQREYCERNSLSRSTLGYWSSKTHREGASGFVEIHSDDQSGPQRPGTEIELLVGRHYRLRLSEGFSVQALSRVLEVLEQR